MNSNQKFTVTILALAAICIYLFASAPTPLPEGTKDKKVGQQIPIEHILRVVAAENDIARALYTREIVGKGLKAGLKFSEKWKEPAVDAGPLPALFLRETSASLQKSPVKLGLFLGSDYPIALSNLFSKDQLAKFEEIKKSGEPAIFIDTITLKDSVSQQYTAMFPDYASVQPCVSCHNEHPDSPKKDWKLNDAMGATTWTYPNESVSYGEAIAIVAALRQGFADAYVGYIEKAKNFKNPPKIGEQWPEDGYFLPSPEVFFAEFSRRASGQTLDRLFAVNTQDNTQ